MNVFHLEIRCDGSDVHSSLMCVNVDALSLPVSSETQALTTEFQADDLVVLESGLATLER